MENNSNLTYQEYVEKLKQYLREEPNRHLHLHSAMHEQEYYQLGLPTMNWFIKNCPDETVVGFDSFCKYLDIIPENMSKEQCISLIYKMAKEAGHPLKYDDFRGREYGKPSITIIRRYWGTINKMKEALGLEIIQPSMIDRITNIQEVTEEIKRVCNTVNQLENRQIITSSDFVKYNSKMSIPSIQKYLSKDLHTTLRKYVSSIGFEFVKAGRGLMYKFDDGEVTTSQFEYMFSNYLRLNGFKYNADYFRDVKYSFIDTEYDGNMNCDYVIKYKNRTIYIEIAGILENYKLYYQQDKPIKFKPKETYRNKLKQKEQMLQNNSCEYFILFPCDLTRDFLFDILNGEYESTKAKISGFYKNNIDWKEIAKIGELKYDHSKLGRDKQPTVVYEEVDKYDDKRESL